MYKVKKMLIVVSDRLGKYLSVSSSLFLEQRGTFVPLVYFTIATKQGTGILQWRICMSHFFSICSTYKMPYSQIIWLTAITVSLQPSTDPSHFLLQSKKNSQKAKYCFCSVLCYTELCDQLLCLIQHVFNSSIMLTTFNLH